MRETWSGDLVRQARAYWARRLPQPCSKCRKPVLPHQRWHVDHWPVSRAEAKRRGIPLRNLQTWPAHARCNESDGGKEGAAITNAKKKTKTTSARRPANTSDAARNIRGVA